jgi:hypothetical protein
MTPERGERASAPQIGGYLAVFHSWWDGISNRLVQLEGFSAIGVC